MALGSGLGLREHLIAICSRLHEEQPENLYVKCEKIFDVSLQHLAEIISLNRSRLNKISVRVVSLHTYITRPKKFWY